MYTVVTKKASDELGLGAVRGIEEAVEFCRGLTGYRGVHQTGKKMESPDRSLEVQTEDKA